jgi:hypothetical protein
VGVERRVCKSSIVRVDDADSPAKILSSYGFQELDKRVVHQDFGGLFSKLIDRKLVAIFYQLQGDSLGLAHTDNGWITESIKDERIFF